MLLKIIIVILLSLIMYKVYKNNVKDYSEEVYKDSELETEASEPFLENEITNQNVKIILYMEKRRSKLIAHLLFLFLGLMGAHKFYMGDNKRGLIYIILMLFSWTIVPLIFIVFFLISDLLCLSDNIDNYNNDLKNIYLK